MIIQGWKSPLETTGSNCPSQTRLTRASCPGPHLDSFWASLTWDTPPPLCFIPKKSTQKSTSRTWKIARRSGSMSMDVKSYPSFPSTSWSHAWRAGSTTGFLSIRQTRRYQKGSSRGLKGDSGPGTSPSHGDTAGTGPAQSGEEWEEISLMHINISKAGAKVIIPHSFCGTQRQNEKQIRSSTSRWGRTSLY